MDYTGIMKFVSKGCESMTHYMHLKDTPFRKIASGEKSIELRLYDEKRRAVKVGDTIVFDSLVDREAHICATVTALHIFPSFKELYAALPLEKCGYSAGEQANASDMDQYYTKEEQTPHGVVGIEITLCKE